MSEDAYQSRTGSLFSDVAVLLLLIICGTAAVVWLSTLSKMDFHATSNQFSIGSFLITNFFGMMVCFKLFGRIGEQAISKRAKLVRYAASFLILVVALPLGMSYLGQSAMDQLYPVLQQFRTK